MATGGEHERVRVTLLIGEANWASWKVQMWHQLRSKKLWNLMKGEEMLAEAVDATILMLQLDSHTLCHQQWFCLCRHWIAR